MTDEKKIQFIKGMVETAKTFPNSRLDYNMELPKDKGITPDNFYGIPAAFNPRVDVNTKIQLIYKW